MRWGIRDDAEDDHSTVETCMREIEACQKVSTGPNFVVNECFLSLSSLQISSFTYSCQKNNSSVMLTMVFIRILIDLYFSFFLMPT